MAEKKPITKFTIDGVELSQDDHLPENLVVKDNEWNPSLPVKLLREIVRQLWIIQKITYADMKMIFKADSTDQKGNPVTKLTYERTCMIETTDWRILTGSWSIYVTNNQLLWASAFGVLSKLAARAYKDALKHYARCFELPHGWFASDEDTGDNDFFWQAPAPQQQPVYNQPQQQYQQAPQQQYQQVPQQQQQYQQAPMQQQAPQQQVPVAQFEPPVQQAPVQQAPIAPAQQGWDMQQFKTLVTQTINGVINKDDISTALIALTSGRPIEAQNSEELKEWMRVEYSRRMLELGK